MDALAGRLVRARASRIMAPHHAQAGQHRLGDLVLAHDDRVGAVALQMGDFLVGMRAGDDRQLRLGGARLGDDLAALEALGNGDEQIARGRRRLAASSMSGARRCR